MNFIKLLYSPRDKIGRLHYIVGYFVASFIGVICVFMPSLLDSLSMDLFSSTKLDAQSLDHIANNITYTMSSTRKILTALCYLAGVVLVIYSYICIVIKRIRDIGISAWWALTLLIPYVNVIVAILLCIYPGRTKYESLAM